ncbi:MAG: putative sigma-54 modulation protein [Solirubrobacteraceae bacterium]|jgi:putative sigma-54 modulation protein|nr:putative sigma-54 modulation protein [Solirubrobacteraceae bacterium]
MQIEVKGRHVTVTDTLREQVERRFAKVGKQVNGSAWLEVELSREKNPANPISEIAEATIHIKGVTLRAREASRDMSHAINLVAEDIARQVKRVRDKRRGPRAGAPFTAPTADELDQPAAGAM